jgi:hypothetical protein
VSSSDELIALRCKQCGGAVKISKSSIGVSFVDIGESEYLYRFVQGEKKIACESCGTEFVNMGRFSEHNGRLVSTGGGAYVGGDITIVNGSFVGRDSVKVYRVVAL